MQSIAVLGGTGALGAAIAARYARAGKDVWIGSRSAEKAQAAAADLAAGTPGANVRGASLSEAADRADIVFVAVPYAAHRETLEAVREAVRGKVVIDATVPLRPPKVGTVQLPPSGAAALDAQEALGPEVRVVSALQTIGAEKLASGRAVDGDVLVSADEAAAGESVCELLAEIGLRAWYVGPLANAAAAEAMTSVLIQINRRYKRVQAGLRITGQPKLDADEPGRSAGLQVHALLGMPLLQSGDDLAGSLAAAIQRSGLAPQDGDVVVVAQKAVSKVEGRALQLDEVAVSREAAALAERTGKPAALAELVLRESSAVMRTRRDLVIVRHRSGQVAANAGIDSSNVADPNGPATVLLWPEDANASARVIRSALEARFGVRLAVIVSDSLGRAWRLGTTGSAIGCSGMNPLRDRRGERDLFGRVLEATLIGVADEIAGAASLVMGEAAEGVPAVLVRGAVYEAVAEGGVGAMLRPREEDLFQ